MVLNWTDEGNGAQMATLAETVYLVRDLGQNGGQLEMSKTGDPFPEFPRMIVRSTDAESAKKYAETMIIGNVDLHLEIYEPYIDEIGPLHCNYLNITFGEASKDRMKESHGG
jgi:hypothetical protein